METVIMSREDAGDVIVNATDVAEWEGYGFAVKVEPHLEPETPAEPDLPAEPDVAPEPPPMPAAKLAVGKKAN